MAHLNAAESVIPQAMAELNFIEYNVNLDTHSYEECDTIVRQLGFKKLSVTKTNTASMWVAGKCIMLLNTRSDTDTGLSGIGFNSDDCLDGSIKCSTTGLNFCKFHGINVYSYPIDMFRKNYEEYFDSTMSEEQSTLPLDYVVGLTVDNNSINVMNEFADKLKFKIIKKSEVFVTTSCVNNRLNILWNNNTSQTKFKKLIITTSDIFAVLADYASMGFDLSEKELVSNVDQFYSSIDKSEIPLPSKQKLKAYGLNIHGKTKSYVIEKQIRHPLPNLDIIISQRFNHNGVNEESIVSYETENTEQHIS